MDVVFQAQLRIAGVLAASANVTFSIVRPDAETAANDQLSNAASITDPAAAVAAASNMKTLMASTTNATLKALLGSAALDMLANSIVNFDAQSPEQQAAVFDMCFAAVGAQEDATAKAALQTKTLNLMKLALASASFDARNGQTALKALATVPASQSSSTLVLLASKIAADASATVGETRTFRANGVNISAVRETASDLGGLTTSGGDASSMEFQSGFSLPGVDSDAIIRPKPIEWEVHLVLLAEAIETLTEIRKYLLYAPDSGSPASKSPDNRSPVPVTGKPAIGFRSGSKVENVSAH